MEHVSTARLTSAEVAFLWSHYITNSLHLGMLAYFQATVEEAAIKNIIDYGLKCATEVNATLENIFDRENMPKPTAFTGADIDLTAPRLFQDTGMLYYLKHAARTAAPSTALAFGNSTREDVRSFVRTALDYAIELDERVTQLLRDKGLLIRPPMLPVPDRIELADEAFMGGLFREKRPLVSLEIATLYLNIDTNILGTHMITAFSQVARSQQLREFFYRGVEIGQKHIKLFSDVLADSHVKTPMTWDAMPTASTTPPFSDRFMLTFVQELCTMGVSHYGSALSTSMRTDLPPLYSRLTAEVLGYLGDGTHMMIKHKWLEVPPGVPNRKELALSR